MHEIRLTISEIADSIWRQFGGRPIPSWKLRRLVDEMESQGSLCVQRAGLYRTIAAQDVGIIADELTRLGWFDREVPPCK